MGKVLCVGLLLFVALLIGRPAAVRAQTDTETPTPTETPAVTDTPGPSPTETPTLTATPDFYLVATLPADGQAGAIVYTVTVGEAAIASELAFVIVLILIVLYLLLRRT